MDRYHWPVAIGKCGALVALLAGCDATLPASGAASSPVSRVESPAPVAQRLPVDDPTVRGLIAKIAAGEHTMTTDGDVVLSPPEFATLVGLGSTGLPTILREIETNSDDWIRYLLIGVAGRIRDPRARPVLERVLESGSLGCQSGAITALRRLAQPESIPALSRLREAMRRNRGHDFTRLQLLEVLYELGETAVIDEVLEIGGRAGGAEAYYAAGIVMRDPPIREALGLGPLPGTNSRPSFDHAQFLKAADEWYHENVLRTPSPYRVTENPTFTEPCAREKQAAWTVLVQSCAAADDDLLVLRPRPADPDITDADADRAITIVTGSGHGFTLNIYAYRPAGDRVACHHLAYRRGPDRSAFPEDKDLSEHAYGQIDRRTYLGLIAGLQTILCAKLEPWWHGPTSGAGGSSANFLVSIAGVDANEGGDPAFCGYPGTPKRERYQRLVAAGAWNRAFVAGQAALAPSAPSAEAKTVFTALFAEVRRQWWEDPSWWWVRERMLGLARDFGDHTLFPALAAYLEPPWGEGIGSERRERCEALNALAAISGTDLRFRGDGTPLDIADAAARYRDWLAHR